MDIVVIKSYVDTRDLESMMNLTRKGIRFNLKVATKFDNIKVHSITLQTSNEFLISTDSPMSQYVQAGQTIIETDIVLKVLPFQL